MGLGSGTFVGLYFATAFAQFVFKRHGGVLKRRVLTKEYVVDDLDGMDISKLPPADVSVDRDDLEMVGRSQEE